MDCEEITTVKDSITCGARSSTRRCKKCHNSRRSLRSWYQSANRIQEWENMSLEDRRKLVAKNKHKGAGKGVRRNVIVSDQASCVDSLKLQQDKPFLTKKQFLIQVIFFQAFFGLSVIPQCRLFRPHWSIFSHFFTLFVHCKMCSSCSLVPGSKVHGRARGSL